MESWDVRLPAPEANDEVVATIHSDQFTAAVDERIYERIVGGGTVERGVVTIVFTNGLTLLVRMGKANDNTVVVQTFGKQPSVRSFDHTQRTVERAEPDKEFGAVTSLVEYTVAP